jgi:predicted DNA-binding transcriptional regulator YafY
MKHIIRSEMASSSTTIEAAYPVKEGETNHEYKIACDIAYRRTNVLRLSAQYLSEREIADRLQISQSTIHRDLAFLRTQTRQNLAYYLYHDFPLRFRKCIIGLEGIINVMSEMMEDPKRTADERMKAAMIKSDTIVKLTDLSDNSDGPALKAAHAYLVRQREELERNKGTMAHEYVMTKKERKEYDDEQSWEKALNHSARETVERAATENEERRPMF